MFFLAEGVPRKGFSHQDCSSMNLTTLITSFNLAFWDHLFFWLSSLVVRAHTI